MGASHIGDEPSEVQTEADMQSRTGLKELSAEVMAMSFGGYHSSATWWGAKGYGQPLLIVVLSLPRERRERGTPVFCRVRREEGGGILHNTSSGRMR